jgi:molybdopterin synthase sulfur carrier subunit
MIRVSLPAHLRSLSETDEEVIVEVVGFVCQRSVLNALERDYPALNGTIRDYETGARRPFLRFFAAGQDISHDSDDIALPAEIVDGTEPFMIIGAIAGG